MFGKVWDWSCLGMVQVFVCLFGMFNKFEFLICFLCVSYSIPGYSSLRGVLNLHQGKRKWATFQQSLCCSVVELILLISCWLFFGDISCKAIFDGWILEMMAWCIESEFLKLVWFIGDFPPLSIPLKKKDIVFCEMEWPDDEVDPS